MLRSWKSKYKELLGEWEEQNLELDKTIAQRNGYKRRYEESERALNSVIHDLVKAHIEIKELKAKLKEKENEL